MYMVLEKEIFHVYGVVHRLIKAGVKPEDIGIITPYNAQKYKLYDKFSNDKYDNLKIESVDGFQGMEKRFIIISTVRSNPSGKIGFMDEPRRLNVAATRGKEGVIFVGNAECLALKNGIWRDLVLFYHSKNLIYQGPLSKLEPVPKEEIFIKDIESDKEEEQEKIKIEKHKEVKKEIIKDYFNSLDAAPVPIKEIKNEIKEQNEIILDNIENKSNEEEEEEKNKNKEKNKYKKKNSNKNSNKNSEEEEEKEFKEEAKDIKNNKKKDKNKNKKGNKNSKKNSEEEEEEKVIEEKKKTNNKKNKKEKEQKNKIEEDIKEDRKYKKKDNKKYLNDSNSDNDEKKSKKNKKMKRVK